MYLKLKDYTKTSLNPGNQRIRIISKAVGSIIKIIRYAISDRRECPDDVHSSESALVYLRRFSADESTPKVRGQPIQNGADSFWCLCFTRICKSLNSQKPLPLKKYVLPGK